MVAREMVFMQELFVWSGVVDGALLKLGRIDLEVRRGALYPCTWAMDNPALPSRRN
jgi:hypothetical protein